MRLFRNNVARQRLATHHNAQLLGETFLVDICFAISDYLTLIELVKFYLTCGHFYRTNVLEKAFKKHFDHFLSMQAQREINGSRDLFAQIKQRIELLVAYGANEDDKKIINRWLYVDKRQFADSCEVFVEKEISMVYKKMVFPKTARLDDNECIDRYRGIIPYKDQQISAYQFFSYAGAVNI